MLSECILWLFPVLATQSATSQDITITNRREGIEANSATIISLGVIHSTESL